jgi:hypothetical protein
MKKEELLYCQWCSKHIHGEHFAAKFDFCLDERIKKPEEAFTVFIEFDTELLHAIFPGKDSPDDIRNDDAIMICCSMECAESLNEEVAKRPDILEVLCIIRIESFYMDKEEVENV